MLNTNSGSARQQAGHLLGEYDGAGRAIQETVWLGDTPLAIVRPTLDAANPQILYLWADHLNTPRQLSEPATQKLVWRWDGEPFGADLAQEGVDSTGKAVVYNLRFPGQYFDKETGLHYNYFRDYDPKTGRYVQSDPIGLEGGINTYGYVGGNPMSRVDPQGLFFTSVDAACMADPAFCAELAGQLAENAAAMSGNQCLQEKAAQFADNMRLVGFALTAASAANAAKGLAQAAKGATAGDNLVYRSVNAAGDVNYVGITNNLERRAAEHLRSKDIVIDAIPGLSNLTRADAKAVEQVLIEYYGLSKNGGSLMNMINSIAKLNPAYAGALQRGADLLKRAGYPGF